MWFSFLFFAFWPCFLALLSRFAFSLCGWSQPVPTVSRPLLFLCPFFCRLPDGLRCVPHPHRCLHVHVQIWETFGETITFATGIQDNVDDETVLDAVCCLLFSYTLCFVHSSVPRFLLCCDCCFGAINALFCAGVLDYGADSGDDALGSATAVKLKMKSCCGPGRGRGGLIQSNTFVK